MQWRRLRESELDHELLWLAVSVAAVSIAWFWVSNRWPTPVCTFHELTGIACPGCGATRCVRSIFRGAWVAAFVMNPLIFVSTVLVAIYDLYAATVLFLRLPRLRFDGKPSWLSLTARFGIPIIILINWAWLVYSKV
jgi:Protein of unknown function (DUF2752)